MIAAGLVLAGVAVIVGWLAGPRRASQLVASMAVIASALCSWSPAPEG